MAHRQIHDVGCDFEGEIAGQEEPLIEVRAVTGEWLAGRCTCGLNPTAPPVIIKNRKPKVSCRKP